MNLQCTLLVIASQTYSVLPVTNRSCLSKRKQLWLEGADVPLHPFGLATFTFVIIFSGEKPYPCRFCGRRFRTNYNKLGHEKKCPDSHGRNLMPLPPNSATGPTLNPADSPQTTGPATSTTPVGSSIGSSDFH